MLAIPPRLLRGARPPW